MKRLWYLSLICVGLGCAQPEWREARAPASRPRWSVESISHCYHGTLTDGYIIRKSAPSRYRVMRPTSLAHIVPVTIGPKRGHDREYVSIVAPAADLTPVFVVGILYSECFESCDVAIRAAQGGALTEIAEPVAWPLPDAPSCEMVFTGPQPGPGNELQSD